MRALSDAFAARLAAETTTLCTCWKLVRRDGAVFGATDHDRVIVRDGVSFEPVHGLDAVSVQASAGLEPGGAAARGVLEASFMTEADLAAGLWNGARVEVFKVDWSQPEHGLGIWSGRLSEVIERDGAFSAELVSLKADLERLVGRTYGRSCDAEVGDVRCGVDLSIALYSGTGFVTEVMGPRVFRASGLGTFASAWFEGGALTWLSGPLATMRARVIRHEGGAAEIELGSTPRHVVQAGWTFRVEAGCDKRFDTCRTKFSNATSFRGFPHMPGPDAALSGPAASGNDGGRR
jgi:uncharacterized phage protein (TIGR02218 family)